MYESRRYSEQIRYTRAQRKVDKIPNSGWRYLQRRQSYFGVCFCVPVLVCVCGKFHSHSTWAYCVFVYIISSRFAHCLCTQNWIKIPKHESNCISTISKNTLQTLMNAMRLQRLDRYRYSFLSLSLLHSLDLPKQCARSLARSTRMIAAPLKFKRKISRISWFRCSEVSFINAIKCFVPQIELK